LKSFLYISLPGQNGFNSYLENPIDGNFEFKFSPFDSNFEELNLKMELADFPEFSFQGLKSLSSSHYQQEEYLQVIEKTKEKIRNKNLGKVVISRSKEFPALNFNALNTFKLLVEKYPNACVYLFGNEKAGLWMGASPETLLKSEAEILTTISLAGTRKIGEESDFGPKEFEEQQLVTDYIREVFEADSGIDELEIAKRTIKKAGNLIHLASNIRAKKNDNFQLNEFLKGFHPTPAVGGFPKPGALKIISELEKHSRSYYSGYFGLKKKDSFHYFVNLRCMQLFNNSVVLYAGGGITKDSIALDEWLETESKMKTLLNVLQDQL
tara:strand:- start:1411 stop:2382 length:972 start_codon:yes stop_codon:yes gene_type:complete